MSQRQAALRYDPALDGLRAIAVGAVVLYHVDTRYLPGGWAGVDVFFVLSGFLITTILSAELTSAARLRLRRFYIHRTLRLMPALFALIAAAIAVSIPLGQFRRAAGASLFAASYTMNWNRAFRWGPEWALGHTWSLAMEEQFYFFLPAFLLVVPAKRRLPVTLALIALIIAWRCNLALNGATVERTYNGFDTHADALLIGCVLAFVGEARRLGKARFWSSASVLGLAGLFVFAPLHSLVTQTVGLTVASLLSIGVIMGARREGWIRRIASLRPLVFTGRISYGLYLWHYPLILLAAPVLPKWLMIVPVAAAYGMAALSYFTVEKYFRRVRDRLDARMSATPDSTG